jgi:ribosomal protein S18 acetylase RimI-like enzyme
VAPLAVRPIGPDEVDLFTSFDDASPLGLKPPLELYLDGLDRWYRPGWSWVALRGDRVLARVAFSGPPPAARPLAMGSLEIGTRPDRVATGVALVRAAYAAMTAGGTGDGGRPEYRQFLPVDWREHPGMRAAVADRRTVARLAGLRFLVERLELRWTAGSGPPLPPRPGRLAFRPLAGDAELLAVVRGTLEGTLDAHARRDLTRLGADGAARAIVEELPGPRSLARLAHDPAGRCVGVTVPALGPWGADIAYVGVLPGHRGNGYAGDLLLEATHLLGRGRGHRDRRHHRRGQHPHGGGVRPLRLRGRRPPHGPHLRPAILCQSVALRGGQSSSVERACLGGIVELDRGTGGDGGRRALPALRPSGRPAAAPRCASGSPSGWPPTRSCWRPCRPPNSNPTCSSRPCSTWVAASPTTLPSAASCWPTATGSWPPSWPAGPRPTGTCWSWSAR